MTRTFRKLLIAAAASAAMLATLAGGVGAQTLDASLTARIREVSFDSTGQTRLVVSVAGSAVEEGGLGAGNFSVTENAEPITSLSVQELFDSQVRPVAVALLMDTSGSAQGQAIEAAKAAARDFVTALPEAVRVAVIPFNTDAAVAQEFTTDRDAVLAAIDDLEAQGGTALYDAVALAQDLLSRQFNTQRNVVIFSDGLDTTSTATLDDVVSRLRELEAPATTVLLTTEQLDEASLRALSAAHRGGEFLRVEDTQELQTAFAAIAQALSSQYVITYPADDRESEELDISVAVNVAGFTASDTSVVVNRRAETGPPPPATVDETPLLGFFANSLGLVLGIAAAFVGILLFLVVVIQGPAGKREERALQRRLRMYSRTERVKEREQTEREGGVLTRSAFGRKAVEFVERMPLMQRYEEKLQKEIDRAAWPLRSSEFILITVGSVVAGLLVGFLLFQRLYWAVLLAVIGGFVPRLVLAQRVAKRTTDFLGQLPDTLQLLAGSLQAGYGFLQALDTVAKEALPPTSSEFARVLAEARLGMPVEQALEDMADRVGGEDFRWVVLAINIQRQVGGNLASLLLTVADTLRERERVRRQIKVLSAEGRLSAIILIALPFLLFGYLTLVNPEYIGELTDATIGKIMMVGAIVLIGVGAVWMRKIIKIDV